jgi:RHS repeat-associated protein
LDYQGEFLFQDDRLSKIITEEGYASPSKKNKKKLTYFYVVSDHLGHSRVVLDEKENVVQTTAYYPYGLPITDLSSEIKNNYLYTGKEFIGEFGLNWYDHHARQYDAEIGRWSAIDPQLVSASPYMAMGNNPMMMIDPDGENPLVAAIIIGAIIAGGSYTASVAFSDGGFSNWNWGQFSGSVITGAASGALTSGVGSAFGGLGGSALNSFGAKALNEAGRAFAHGVVQGSLGMAQGGSFKNGFASGALGSMGGSAFGAVGGKFAKSGVGMTSFSALSGGVGAELSGGDFWRGAGTGATIGLLNHFMHQVEGNLEEKRASKGVSQTGDKFYSEKGVKIWDTQMKGHPNRVFVIRDEDMRAYEKKLAYAKDVNSPGILHHWAKRNSILYTIGRIDPNSKTFGTYAKRGTWTDVAAFAHFFAEGASAGRLGGGAHLRGNLGLQNHYEQQFGARAYWSNYYSYKIFKAWWN